MSAIAEAAQGTQAGEPAQPVAVESGATPSEVTTAPATEPAPQPEMDWSKVDLEALPKDFLAKVEQAKFKSMDAAFTRKQQDLAREKAELYDRLASRLAPEATAPDAVAEAARRLREGDLDAVSSIPDLIERELAPFKQQQAYAQAVQIAEQRHPFVREKATEIGEALASNPALASWAFQNASQNLPYALEGLAIAMERDTLRGQLEAAKAAQEATVAARVKEELAKAMAQAKQLPTRTSQAGMTPTASPLAGSENLTPRQRWVKHLDDSGIPVEPLLREQAARGL